MVMVNPGLTERPPAILRVGWEAYASSKTERVLVHDKRLDGREHERCVKLVATAAGSPPTPSPLTASPTAAILKHKAVESTLQQASAG
jgi:hypothetical protein